jgi:hypothetical protein
VQGGKGCFPLETPLYRLPPLWSPSGLHICDISRLGVLYLFQTYFILHIALLTQDLRKRTTMAETPHSPPCGSEEAPSSVYAELQVAGDWSLFGGIQPLRSDDDDNDDDDHMSDIVVATRNDDIKMEEAPTEPESGQTQLQSDGGVQGRERSAGLRADLCDPGLPRIAKGLRYVAFGYIWTSPFVDQYTLSK